MSERFGNFVDKFNGASLGSRWTLFSGTTPPHTGGAIVATADFDMSAGAAAPSPGHQTGAFTGKYAIQEFLTTPQYGSWLYVGAFPGFLGFDIYDGNIEVAYEEVATPAVVYTAVYDTDLHKAVRIREDDGTLYAEIWNGYEWNVVFSVTTPAWVASTDCFDSQGGYVNGTPGVGEAVTFYGYNTLDPAISGGIDSWCPASVTDPESSDPGDLGDFEPSQTPIYTSQKNIVDIAFDPRTGMLMRTQGGFGAFGESPPTSMKVSFSQDCGRTWSAEVDLATVIGASYQLTVPSINGIFHYPVSVIPGANEGEWMIFDYVGGYYLSTDNGLTWSARQMSGITPVQMSTPYNHAHYYGIVGTDGSFNTRQLSPIHDLDTPQIGYSFGIEVPFRVGIRRSIGPNGSGGWANSLEPTDQASGGAGWMHGLTPPVLGAGNGRWIACVGYQDTQGENDTTFEPEIIPAMRINTSPTLAPAGWQTPFWPVSEAWVLDMYGGQKTGGSYGQAYLQFEYGAGRLKFIPQEGHSAGGRWWLMGMQDSVIYSDDNGETWSNSLSDHTANEDAIHPMLNWRASHALGYRYTPSKILDILHDPADFRRLMAVGVTYDRAGISNRLAVYCCSTDGGNSWGPVGQLSLKLSNITSGGVGSDFDSPAMVRHGFPCLFNA